MARKGTSQEWSAICLDFIMQRQDSKGVLCLPAAHFVPSLEWKHFPHGVVNNRSMNTEPFLSLLLSCSCIFFSFFLYVQWCDCWLSSTGYQQPTGPQSVSLYKSPSSQASILGPAPSLTNASPPCCVLG